MKPTRQVLFDTKHVLFSKGIFQFHVGAMLVALKPLGVITHMFDQYLQPWAWPKMVGTATGQDAFCAKRIKSCMENSVLTCQASECVSMYAVIANFVEQGFLHNPSPAIQAHGRCSMQFVSIIEMILNSCRYAIDADALGDGIKAYMESFRDLYGDNHMPPKFHQMMHFKGFIASLG